MDTSETYIKMCEKAEEIQKLWVPTNGDFCWHDNEGEEVFGSWEFPAQTSTVNISQETDRDWWHHWLWLPRQDQLQEMMGLPGRQLMKQFRDFLIWITGVKGWDRYNEGCVPDTTMPYGIFLPRFEQLWLAFVMKEKFNKVWNGEKWVVGK